MPPSRPYSAPPSTGFQTGLQTNSQADARTDTPAGVQPGYNPELGYDPSKPSKSQRKRDMTALQKLGVELVAASRERLERVDMPDNLRDAIREAQRTTSHEGRRRQMQYIGRLMRDVDAGPIEAALAVWHGESGAETALLHSLERWRKRLLEDDRALDALCSQHSAALNPMTLQRLRTHMRMARKEQAENRPPKHFRELFQVLKEILGTDTSEAGNEDEDGD